MTTSFKLQCLHDIEGQIETPRNCFIKTDTTVQMRYTVGTRTKYIFLPDKVAVAKFLRSKGIIDAFVDDPAAGVRMFKKELVTRTLENGAPYQYERTAEYYWHDINFTGSMVQTFAAENEYNRAHETVLDKVINFLI